MSHKRVTCITHHESGQVIKKYKDGKRNGQWRYIDSLGITKTLEYYKKGKLKGARYYNSKGDVYKRLDAKGRIKEIEDCGCN